MQVFPRKDKKTSLKGILTFLIDPRIGPLIEDTFPYGLTSSSKMFSLTLEMARHISSTLRSSSEDEIFRYLYLGDFGLVGVLLTFKESVEKWFSIIVLFNSDASTTIWRKRNKILKILREGMEMIKRGETRARVLEDLYDKLVKIKI